MELRILAKVLQQVRIEAGISQKALSLQMGKPSNFIWRVESDRTLPDIITILDVANITGVDAADIVAQAIAEAQKKAP